MDIVEEWRRVGEDWVLCWAVSDLMMALKPLWKPSNVNSGWSHHAIIMMPLHGLVLRKIHDGQHNYHNGIDCITQSNHMTPQTRSLPNMWYVPSVSPSLKMGLPSIGTRCCQATFWWEDVHQAVVIHELHSRPRWFLSPDATSRMPSVSADRTDGDSGYWQHGNYLSVLPMGLV